jgi:hypothetical protein
MIFVTGDTHGKDFDRFLPHNFLEGYTLTKNDYVIILGDFGLLWNNNRTVDEQYWIDWLDNRPWTTLFVDGNHENFYLLNNLKDVDMFGSTVREVSNSIFHLKRGEVYNINDKLFFTIGGALSIDTVGRHFHTSWWPEEQPSYSEFERGLSNLELYDNCVDYILSHNGPLNILLKYVKNKRNKYASLESLYKDNVSQYLQDVCNKTIFKKMYFGHWHDEWSYNGCLYNNKSFNMVYRKIKRVI